MYGIKIKSTRDTEAFWMQSLSEYQAFGNKRMLTFPTRAEAEEYAQNLEIKNYDIEKIE